MQIKLLVDKETVKDFLQIRLNILSLRIGKSDIFLNPFDDNSQVA